MESRISVIIPVYNAERYIEECIRSVVNQTFTPWEIIVIDDGSNDKSVEKVKSHNRQITIISQENRGAGSARNAGIRIAKGDFLAFLDADDVWLPDTLENQINRLIENTSLDMVFGAVEQFYSPDVYPHEKPGIHHEMYPPRGFVPGAMLINRESFLRVGLFNESLVLGEFIDWFAKAREVGLRFTVSSHIVMRRRIHDKNTGILHKMNRKDYTSIIREKLLRNKGGKDETV
ncbi:MAG TPA: glycosyltransferase family A protein [Saprospiraceae bacterium]|nr:glycosyltransferase family A protein [Saprospiraceae bacterium]